MSKGERERYVYYLQDKGLQLLFGGSKLTLQIMAKLFYCSMPKIHVVFFKEFPRNLSSTTTLNSLNFCVIENVGGSELG